jgi:transglutaminase-like putative cysteine protease
MATDDSTFPDLDGSRDYSRVLLVLVCLLAVLVAAAALPVLAPSGTQSPIESVVPLPEMPSSDGGGSSSGPTAGGLGALSPGQQTDVGGSLGGESTLTSQSAEIHFVVRSTDAAYWRTGAYGTYTGSGWEQVGEVEPSDGSIETRGADGRQVTYEVRLNRTAQSLPTVWRPERISREDALVTGGRAVQVEQAVPAGTTYEGVSNRPPDDESLLRTAGTDYPSDVERQYTQLPSETEERLGPITAEITAGASNPYEQARQVESWLESNKEYSLNVSEPPEDDVATQFVTEMDAGYCEYFATSMVAMLRSQDVPARYVVGYSTGQPAGENTYTVRGMNAHAWVEVYFPDAGWVKFDPTPASERLQQEQQSLANQTDQSVETPLPEETPTPTETSAATDTEDAPGTPTETATPAETSGESGDGRESGSNDGDGTGESHHGTTDDGGDGYSVSLNRSAAPGAVVEVTVTDNGGPVTDAGVSFNGDRIGTTGPDGTVVGEVPYENELTISVEGAPQHSLAGPPIPGSVDGRLYALQAPLANTSTTFDLSTNATVAVTGDAVTGNTVTVTAAVDDVPVRDAPVTLDGERVARTDRDGRAEVTLPAEPGNVTLAVERGSVSGTTTLRLARLNVTTRPTAPLALPSTGVEVNTTVGGESAPGANVTVDGEQVATTGVDGTTTVTLPLAASATVGVSRHGQRRTATYDGLFLNLGAAVLALGLAAGGVVATARRYEVTPQAGRHWPRRAVQWAVGLVVAVGSAADSALSRLAVRARLTVDHLRALYEGRRTLGELLDALRAWVDERVKEARTPIEALGVADVVSDGANGERADDAHATIRDSWERLLDAVSVRRPQTHTPGELADHAVAVDDLPPADVETLRDAFRAVEYGQRDPAERAADVGAAAESIERAVEATDETEAESGASSSGTDPAPTDAGVAN